MVPRYEHDGQALIALSPGTGPGLNPSRRGRVHVRTQPKPVDDLLDGATKLCDIDRLEQNRIRDAVAEHDIVGSGANPRERVNPTVAMPVLSERTAQGSAVATRRSSSMTGPRPGMLFHVDAEEQPRDVHRSPRRDPPRPESSVSRRSSPKARRPSPRVRWTTTSSWGFAAGVPNAALPEAGGSRSVDAGPEVPAPATVPLLQGQPR